MSNDLKKVAEDSARGSFFLISGTALATVIMSVSAILIGRFLGPELYGQYTLATVVPQLLYLFTDLGINQGVTKFIANFNVHGETERLAKTIRYAMLLKTAIGVVLFIVNYVFAESFAIIFLQRPDLAFALRLTSISILLQVIFTTASAAFVGLDKTEYSALTTNIQALAKTIIQIMLVILGLGVTGALIGHVASYAVAGVASALVLFIIVRKISKTGTKSNGIDDLKKLITYGAPLYITILLTGFIPLYQNIILANYTTDAEIGNYRAAGNFVTLMTVLSIPITTSLLPAFSKIDSSGKEKIKLFFKLANKYTALLIVPATALMIIFADPIVRIIYGSTYQTAPNFLATYSAVYLLVGFGYITLASFYNGLGETRKTFYIGVLTFGVLGVLSPFLTGIYGVQGLIGAFLVASLVGTLYAVLAAWNKFRIEFDVRSLTKIYLIAALSSVPAILILWLAPFSNVVRLVAGTLVFLIAYLTLAGLMRIMTPSEIKTVSEIANRIQILKFVANPVLRYLSRFSGNSLVSGEKTYMRKDSSDREIEEYIIAQVEGSKPETVEKLTATLQKKYNLSMDKIIGLLTKLAEEGRLNLTPGELPSSNHARAATSSKSTWLWATVATVIAASGVALAIPEGAYPFVFLRYILGGALVLFLPGYAFITALYPEELPFKTSEETVAIVERFVLSVGMSIALTCLVGLLINYTPWGIRLVPLVISLSIVTIVSAFVAAARSKRNLPSSKDRNDIQSYDQV